MENLSIIVALLVALSVASERLVEIIKGLIPSLDKENTDPIKEGRRKSCLQLLAVIAGIVTTLLASPAIEGVIPNLDWISIIALGLLASGGSGFWNSVTTYVNKAKDIKKSQAQQEKQNATGG